jgi:spermidine synthase
LKFQSNILKLALFATGLSGIVTEYVLATLATYFLGDSIVQWTMTLSVMLFAMGLGSRFSRFIKKNLIISIIAVELILSVVVSFSSVIVYSCAGYTNYIGVLIYALSLLTGLLIGMEIPIAIRLNQRFERLRVNVSSIIEKDYYGSLLGGVFFAFVGLPFFGLTYTPFILGGVNLMVALVLLYVLQKELSRVLTFRLVFVTIFVISFIGLGLNFAGPIILFGEQKKYKDKIIYEEQSKYQRIVITKWNDHHWLFLNGNQQFSSLDEAMYHEPLVHPVMQLSKKPSNVLIIGGGDGCAVREILKYSSVKDITLVDLDPAMTRLGSEHPVLISLNDSSMYSEKLTIINEDGFIYLNEVEELFDVIIVDLPDPRSIEIARMYSKEFYEQCYLKLRPNGALITQAGSPYYAMKAFYCVKESMSAAKFTVQAMHNQILTMGQWGWAIGVKNMDAQHLKESLKQLTFDNVQTDWINSDGMQHMLLFGKNFFWDQSDSVKVNTTTEPILYKYYLKGNWDVY